MKGQETKMTGGEGGIRTLDTGFGPYNGLANRRLQPLGHLSAVCFQQFTTPGEMDSPPAAACDGRSNQESLAT